MKPCAGGVTAKAAAALVHGLDPLSSLRFNAIEFNIWRRRTNRFGHAGPVLHTVCRPEFDNDLVRRNLAHDRFRFMDGCRALRVEYDGRFRVTTTKGDLVARQLVGADGAYSVVNRTFRVASPRALATAIEVNLPRGVGDAAVPCLDYGAIDQGYGWVFPKPDHLSVGLYTVSPRTRHIRAQFLAYLRSKGLAVVDDLLPQLEGFRVPIGGFRLRVPAYPVYVVGDAGGFADALTGEGIYSALESGRLAGEAAVDVACGRNTHRAYYRRLWRSVLSDTALSYFSAQHFYKDLDRGFRVLENPLVWRPLVEGAAAGRDAQRMRPEGREPSAAIDPEPGRRDCRPQCGRTIVERSVELQLSVGFPEHLTWPRRLRSSVGVLAASARRTNWPSAASTSACSRAGRSSAARRAASRYRTARSKGASCCRANTASVSFQASIVTFQTRCRAFRSATTRGACWTTWSRPREPCWRARAHRICWCARGFRATALTGKPPSGARWGSWASSRRATCSSMPAVCSSG